MHDPEIRFLSRDVEELIHPTGHLHVDPLIFLRGMKMRIGDFAMTQANNSKQSPQRKIHSLRRWALLGSVAVVGLPLAFAGPLDHARFSGVFWPAAAQAAESQPGPAGFADLVAKVKPAVVAVRVKIDEQTVSSGTNQDEEPGLPPFLQGSPFEKLFRQYGDLPRIGRHQIITGVGSGFFISPDGYAVTNNHVVDHAKSVQVTTDDGTKYTAKVIGTDPKTDLALIKVDGKSDFAYVKFEDTAPRVGDWVVAVGNPFGLGGTVTAGIVSAEGRNIGSGAYDYLQIDAPINKGNSGGPTFDMNGNVAGVNTAIYSPSGGSVGIGFDVTAQTAKSVVSQLKDKGEVTRGWLGVQIQPVTSGVADSLGLKSAQGALVDEAQPNSPAANAGIQSGDVITAINAKPVKDSRQLARQIAGLAPGSSVKLDLIRKGETKTLTVALGTMPNQQQASAGEDRPKQARNVPHLGLTVAPAADVAGSDDRGAVVTSVDPEGQAADHGLQTGDIILDVGGKAVSNGSDIRNAVSEAKTDGKHDVLMKVKTSQATKFVAMPVG
jgi:serine protease Do